MRTLKKIAVVIFAVAIQNIPAIAGGNSVKAELNGLIPIAENIEEPVSEDFFASKEKRQQKLNPDSLKAISEDEEAPVDDVDFSAFESYKKTKPILPLNGLISIDKDRESAVEETVLSIARRSRGR